jgi:ketosteroid isomerase-like protein
MRVRHPLHGAVAVLAFAGASASSQAAELTAEDRQEIAAIPAAFTEHALAGNWEAVAALYHEDAIQMLPDAPPVEGRDDIRDALALMLGAEGGVRLTDFAVAILETEAFGNLVYVRAEYRFEVALLDDDGIAVGQSGPYVNILRRDEDDALRIWRQIVSREHPPVPPG